MRIWWFGGRVSAGEGDGGGAAGTGGGGCEGFGRRRAFQWEGNCEGLAVSTLSSSSKVANFNLYDVALAVFSVVCTVESSTDVENQSPPVEDRAQPVAIDIQHNEITGDVHVAGGGPPQPHEVEPLPRDPLGRSWTVSHEVHQTKSSDKFINDNFYYPSHFIWQPYDLASLPEYCLTGRHVWMTQSLLIYFERVEWHFPNRVCLQYNMSQVIPRDCDTGGEFDHWGHPNTDWELKHHVYIDMWNARADTIYGREAAGEYVDAGYSSPYMLWYRSITRLLVGKPVQNIPSGYQGGHATVLVLPSPSPVTAVEHVPLTSHSTIRTPPAYGPSASTLERSNRPHTPGSNAPISANETTAVHHMPSPLLHESEMEGIVKDIPSKIPPTSTDPLACYEM
ncbi:hypothetical protein RJ639_000138, partial [Escallonia herrerae]